MTTRRQAILQATGEAASVFDRFPVGHRTSFDIVGAATLLDIPVLFRPLKSLLGACVEAEDGTRGLLVTTERDHHVQRFTLAHELGHCLLGHGSFFDESVNVNGQYGADDSMLDELAANTFAAELLGAKPLLVTAAAKHKWGKASLKLPEHVYQLGLRLGLSFQATCWALVTHKVLTRAEARHLQSQAVKELKLRLAPANLHPNPWADVWELSEKDTDSVLEASPEDLFVLRLSESASAGYLWDFVERGLDGEIVDERFDLAEAYGGATRRSLYLRFRTPGFHRLYLIHNRPWNKQELSYVDLSIQNYGKETMGVPRRLREQALRREVA